MANLPANLLFVAEYCCDILRSSCRLLLVTVSLEKNSMVWGVIMFVGIGDFEGGVFWRPGWGIEMFEDLESSRK